MNITARSYCTGYTGLEMAVRQAFGDFEVLSHSDIKPAANRLLDHHYPHIPNLGDMRAINYAELEPADLMIGSWPCQPHSSAGKRLGEADPRDLWPEYLRAIDAHRPTIFFGENVARIATNGELRRVVRSLAERGYVGAWRSLRASDVGACHRRDRMFLVAADAAGVGRLQGRPEYARELGRPDAPVGSAGLHPLTLLPTPQARDVKGPACRRPHSDGYNRRDRQMDLPNTVVNLLPTPTANLGDNQVRGADARRYRGPKSSPDGGRSSLDDFIAAVDERSPWMADRLPDDSRWGVYAAAIARHERALGRLAPEPTHPGLNTPRPQLAARFVEWMQMLPQGWVCDVPELGSKRSPASDRNAMLSMLGDGVVPAQGAAAFSFLLDHLAQRLTSGVAA